MAENMAQPQDVANRLLRPLTNLEEDSAVHLLDQAWIRLLILVDNLARRIDSEEIPQAVVTGVQAEMVANVLKNPMNLRQQSRTRSIDDYSETDNDTYDKAVSSGQLFPTDEHLKMLSPRRRGSFTITPS